MINLSEYHMDSSMVNDEISLFLKEYGLDVFKYESIRYKESKVYLSIQNQENFIKKLDSSLVSLLEELKRKLPICLFDNGLFYIGDRVLSKVISFTEKQFLEEIKYYIQNDYEACYKQLREVERGIQKLINEVFFLLIEKNNLGYNAIILNECQVKDKSFYPGDTVFIKTGKLNDELEEDILPIGMYTQKTNELLTDSIPKNIQAVPFKEEDVCLYLAVNKALDISTGKAGAQISHAVKNYMHNVINTPRNPKNQRNYKTILQYDLMCSKEFEQALYEYYRINAQKTIVLAMKEKDLKKFEEKGYIVIRDNGLTEIPPNTLTAIAFGIVPKSLKPKFLNSFQLLKNTQKEKQSD